MRFSCIKSSQTTFTCRNKKKCRVNECRKYHRELLHEVKYDNKKEKNEVDSKPVKAEKLVTYTIKPHMIQ